MSWHYTALHLIVEFALKWGGGGGAKLQSYVWLGGVNASLHDLPLCFAV